MMHNLSTPHVHVANWKVAATASWVTGRSSPNIGKVK
jgi:hypothetical protein